MSLGSTEAIKRAVAAGVGVAIVSRLSVGLELQLNRLSLIRLSDLRIHRPLYLLKDRFRRESAAVGAFLSTLDETVRPAPPKRSARP